MSSVDAYQLRWSDVVVAAMMHRVKLAELGPHSIIIDRDVFDQLLAVAEAACQADSPSWGRPELEVRPKEDGSYSATPRDPTLGSASETGRTLLESITTAKRAFAHRVEQLIR